ASRSFTTKRILSIRVLSKPGGQGISQVSFRQTSAAPALIVGVPKPVCDELFQKNTLIGTSGSETFTSAEMRPNWLQSEMSLKWSVPISAVFSLGQQPAFWFHSKYKEPAGVVGLAPRCVTGSNPNFLDGDDQSNQFPK